MRRVCGTHLSAWHLPAFLSNTGNITSANRVSPIIDPKDQWLKVACFLLLGQKWQCFGLNQVSKILTHPTLTLFGSIPFQDIFHIRTVPSRIGLVAPLHWEDEISLSYKWPNAACPPVAVHSTRRMFLSFLLDQLTHMHVHMHAVFHRFGRALSRTLYSLDTRLWIERDIDYFAWTLEPSQTRDDWNPSTLYINCYDQCRFWVWDRFKNID